MRQSPIYHIFNDDLIFYFIKKIKGIESNILISQSINCQIIIIIFIYFILKTICQDKVFCKLREYSLLCSLNLPLFVRQAHQKRG